jgi:hypothetical protein
LTSLDLGVHGHISDNYTRLLQLLRICTGLVELKVELPVQFIYLQSFADVRSVLLQLIETKVIPKDDGAHEGLAMDGVSQLVEPMAYLKRLKVSCIVPATSLVPCPTFGASLYAQDSKITLFLRESLQNALEDKGMETTLEICL